MLEVLLVISVSLCYQNTQWSLACLFSKFYFRHEPGFVRMPCWKWSKFMDEQHRPRFSPSKWGHFGAQLYVGNAHKKGYL